MRFAIALAVVAVAWATAVYIHERHVTVSGVVCTSSCGQFGEQDTGTSWSQHPAWEEPVAVLLALGGLAVAVGVDASARRHSA